MFFGNFVLQLSVTRSSNHQTYLRPCLGFVIGNWHGHGSYFGSFGGFGEKNGFSEMCIELFIKQLKIGISIYRTFSRVKAVKAPISYNLH